MNGFTVGAIVVALLAVAVWADRREAAECAAKGGHILSKTSVGVGVAGNGGVAVVPTTTDFCVSADGRILE